MNKEIRSRIWFNFFLILALTLNFCGCGGLPEKSKIEITINPNPVPYFIEMQGWFYEIALNESNGVGVTLSTVTLDEYNEDEQLTNTSVWGEQKIIDKFGSNYLSAFSSLQGSVGYLIGPEESFAKYMIITIEGIDDNGNTIESMVQVDFFSIKFI